MQSTPTPTQPLAAAAPRLHPLVAGAAVAVIAVSALAGVAIVNSQVSARHTVESQVLAAAGAPAAAVDSAPAAAQPVAPPVAPPAAAAPSRAPARSEARPASRPAPLPAPREPQTATAPSAPAADYPSTPVVTAAPVCADCGTVLAVREVKTAGQGTGIGAVAGGVLGGVLGNQVGRGSGRDAARILGAVGGAVAGHQVEKQARASLRYEIDVQMDDGSVRTLSRDAAPTLRSGDAVRVDGNRLLHADGRPVALRANTRPAVAASGDGGS